MINGYRTVKRVFILRIYYLLIFRPSDHGPIIRTDRIIVQCSNLTQILKYLKIFD